MKRVVIVGGGITGLSAAWALRQMRDSPEIILLEESDRLGGCIYTESYDGFLMEHGPDVFLTRKPEAAQLCASLGLRLQSTNAHLRGVYLRRGEKLYPMPEGMSGLVPSRIWPLLRSPLLSFQGKLRALAELVIPPKIDDSDESVAAFFTRRFGSEAFHHLIEPLLGGVIGDQSDRLSIRALMPHLLNLESNPGSILLGMDQVVAQQSTGSLQSLPDGLSSMIDALFVGSRENVRLEQKVTAITSATPCWNVSLSCGASITATHLILAVSAQSASEMLASFHEPLANLLRGIPYRSGTLVHLAYRETDLGKPLVGHGHLVPLEESSSLAACTWSANKLSGRAPAGHALFRLYFRGDNLSDSSVLSEAQAEMNQAFSISACPLLTRVHRYTASLPQYTLGHIERIEEIHKIINSLEGLFLAGNYFEGVGIPDCIRSGMQAANQMITSETGVKRIASS